MVATAQPSPQALLRPPSLVWMAAFVLALMLAACNQSKPAPTPATPQVGVYQVQLQSQPITVELPGRTSARLVAEIRPQVGGIVRRRLFEEGAQVKAGQVLYEIDPASFAAAVASAQAGVVKAQASVAAAEVTARRNAELVKIEAISQQLYDDSQAALKQAQAELATARAALQTAQINLERTRITAPIAGRVDLSTVTPGALVTANQEAALTTVQQLDPMRVDIVQSSSELLRLRRELANGSLTRDNNDEVTVQLLLEDGNKYPHNGRLQVSGVTVNAGTGAVTLRAQVPNPEGLLLPGMYVRAVLQAGVAEQAMMVPQQGVTRQPNGQASALVVGADNKVERRTLTLDRAIGDRWQVTAGLKPGDLVIVEGSQRARVGAVVQPLVAGGASAVPVAAGKPAPVVNTAAAKAPAVTAPATTATSATTSATAATSTATNASAPLPAVTPTK